MNDAKQHILSRIRNAHIANPIRPKSLEQKIKKFSDEQDQDLRLLFVNRFTEVGGHFVYCQNAAKLLEQLNLTLQKFGDPPNVSCQHNQIKESLKININWKDKPQDADITITTCDYLVARTGSVALTDVKDRLDSVSSPIHIVIANKNQLVFDLKEVTDINHSYNALTIITGPSRTADIEKTLVIGVHGSKHLYVFLIESSD